MSNLINHKRYCKYNIAEDTSIFSGYYGQYAVDTSLLIRLAKDIGFSYELYLTLARLDEAAANSMIVTMSKKNSHQEIILLVDDEENVVVDYSLESDRLPLLNCEFVKRVRSLVETSEEIEISESYYTHKDKLSTVLIKKVKPLSIEEKYVDKPSNFVDYPVGVLLVNDEVNTTYSRLVVYIEGQPVYLPASYYNTTTSRYKRSTSSSLEALEVLVLKIIEDLREGDLYNKIYDFHLRYKTNKSIFASYEEYNSVVRTMRKVPAIIEDSSFLESLLSKYDNFEEKYVQLEDKKSSYLWRCTALSDTTVGALVSITLKILSELSAPSLEVLAIRDLLGSYLSTNRIAEEIARESIR